MTLPELCTSAPMTGSITAVMARMMATKFSAMEKVRLHFIVSIMRFARRCRCGSSRSSSPTRTMSAASMAMSLPTPPMAMPTVARLSAGASLMPSPVMQTGRPAASASSMKRSLSSGRQPAR